MKVLVIDDDPQARVLLRRSLEILGGLAVIEADSGREGARLAVSERPDCVLLDANMPDWDGPETLHAIRATDAGAAMSVIFVTGASSEDEVARLEALGVTGVLKKPFEPRSFVAAVLALTSGSRSAQHEKSKEHEAL